MFPSCYDKNCQHQRTPKKDIGICLKWKLHQIGGLSTRVTPIITPIGIIEQRYVEEEGYEFCRGYPYLRRFLS